VSSGGRRGLSATSFCLVFVTDRRPHSTIHRQGPRLPGCRCSYLEQFIPARHFCTFAACLPVTPQNYLFTISYPSESLAMYTVQHSRSDVSDTFILDSLIVHVAYLPWSLFDTKKMALNDPGWPFLVRLVCLGIGISWAFACFLLFRQN